MIYTSNNQGCHIHLHQSDSIHWAEILDRAAVPENDGYHHTSWQVVTESHISDVFHHTQWNNSVLHTHTRYHFLI